MYFDYYSVKTFMSDIMESFIDKTLQLITLERDAETLESLENVSKQMECLSKLESHGICLSRLHVGSQHIGLYGRLVVTLEPSLAGHKQLPSTSITSGDIVGVYSRGKPVSDNDLSGIVLRKDKISLAVAFDQIDNSLDLTAHDGALVVIKLANDVTYRRMKRALEDLRTGKRCQHLARVLFGEQVLSPPDPRFVAMLSCSTEAEQFSFINKSLNESQRISVLFALSRPDVAVIHGPPGTGKTTTLVELILQSVKLGQKVLACAPSNIAVDNMVERLAQGNARVVRLGHPARLSESIQRLSLDALLHSVDSAQIIMDVRKDIKKALTSLHQSRGSADRSKWRGELKILRKELQNREQRAIKDLLKGADVILSTTTGASLEGPLKHLPKTHFGLTVIDECAQAVEAGCWIPLLHSPKCVLAGDHKQLPPTILSKEAAENGLSLSLMERVIELYQDNITTVLTVQYRMHKHIMSCSSKFFYKDKLQPHFSVSEHTLSDLDGVYADQLTNIPLVFIDTAGCHMTELETQDEQSKGNEGEADLVVHHLKALVGAGLSSTQLAVIAPYSLQVELIRKRLVFIGNPMSSIEVHTVDGFQGREKEVVVISFTRSNNKGEYGFLRESRRTNVAVTRARRHLVLIGDSSTISQECFIKELVDYCHQHGEVWSAQEYINDPSFESGSYHTPPSPKSKPHSMDPSSSLKRTSKDKHHSKANNTVTSSLSSTVKWGNSVPNQLTETTSFEIMLSEFCDGPTTILTFSSSLTGNERRIIHEISERMGLLHESRGEGSERFIEVQKKRSQYSSPVSVIEEITAAETDSCKTVANIKAGTTGDRLVRTDVSDCLEISNVTNASSTASSNQRKTSVKKKPEQKVITKNSSEDLDSLISEMSKLDSTCAHSKCKKSIKLFSVKCRHCSRRHCVEHSLPEVHGCGDAAKRSARMSASSKSIRSSTSSNVDRARLQKKLHSKIDKMSKKGNPRTLS